MGKKDDCNLRLMHILRRLKGRVKHFFLFFKEKIWNDTRMGKLPFFLFGWTIPLSDVSYWVPFGSPVLTHLLEVQQPILTRPVNTRSWISHFVMLKSGSSGGWEPWLHLVSNVWKSWWESKWNSAHGKTLRDCDLLLITWDRGKGSLCLNRRDALPPWVSI